MYPELSLKARHAGVPIWLMISAKVSLIEMFAFFCFVAESGVVEQRAVLATQRYDYLSLSGRDLHLER
jgi:hypothetical protein